MAALIPVPTHFKYRNVQIYKSQSLGHGAYGAVYRAKCDALPCAAKLLHPILFEDNDPGSVRIMQCFEQECQFLSGIRHPNIVQYLGTCRDPDSNHPVLLMEIMDESLTHFLEQSQQPLPYHTEVNLCHDIALALAYLHSSDIIHRDLSSNNVLLIAGSRAKVTDFGTSKMMSVNRRMTPFTFCPGTEVYMSPEALKNPPLYTDKLDCFSFGVLEIQTMTRQFPNPGPAMQEVEDQRYRFGRIQVPIPDNERRKSHIDLIDPTHPLLPTAFRCLSYFERDRPSAQDLCQQLAALKEAPHYAQSMQQAQDSTTATERQLRQLFEQHAQQNQELQQQLMARDTEIQTLQQLLQQANQEKQFVIEAKERQLQQQLQAHEDGIAQFQHTINQLTQELEQARHQVAEKKRAIEARERQLQQQLQANEEATTHFQQTINQLTQALEQTHRQVAEKQQSVKAKERQIWRLHQQLQANEEPAGQLQQIINPLTQELEQAQRQLQQPNQHLQASTQSQQNPKQQKQDLSWTCMNTVADTETAELMYRGATVSNGKMVYFNDIGSITVHAYNSDNQEWYKLPSCPQQYFSLVITTGMLTAVGGLQKSEPIDSLLSLTEDGKWVEYFPPMPTKRYHLAAVCEEKSLIAAGGWGGSELRTVEVLDMDSLQWSTANSLPHPFLEATAVICEDKLYLLDQNDQTRSVLTCSVPQLLQSCKPQSPDETVEQCTVWHQIADTPYHHSTCATLCGWILAIGGYDTTGKDTNAVQVYNPTSDSWQAMRGMPTARRRALVAVLPGGRMMVVGGSRSGGLTIEIATVL